MLSLKIKLLMSLFIIITTEAVAAPAWYRGEVTRVWPFGLDGSFIVTLKNDSLDSCKHKYAYFYKSQVGEASVKSNFALALAALTTKRHFGIVIDKSINGDGGYCRAKSADLR